MTTSWPARLLSHLTLQSYRQRREQGYRLARHPTTDLTLSTNLNDYFPGGHPEDRISLIPDPADWDDFDHDLNPRNWQLKKKILATILVTQISWLVQFASAIDVSVMGGIEAKFNVGPYVSALAIGLFLIGFALGAPIAGPLSEATGRNPVYIISLFFFLISTLIAALSDSLVLFLMARFAAGFFGSASLVCAGGTISDLWNPRDQLLAFPLYAAGGFSGIAAGPAAGGVMAQESGHEFPEMTEWATLITGAVVFLMVATFQPETYAPMLLKWKTGLVIDRMKPEERELIFPPSHGTKMDQKLKAFARELWIAFTRPILMAVREPIIAVLSINLSLIYLIVFTILPGYHAIFVEIYHFGPARYGATFYGLAVGMFAGLWFAMGLASYWRNNHHGPFLPNFEPEARLDFAYLGAPSIAVSLFWMGFTAREGISPWSPILASALLGFGVICVFLSSYMYIIHAYGTYAASGLVFITLVRYLVAGGMVVAGVGMFEHLGVPTTFSILGTVATMLVPVPFCLLRWGCRLRRKSTLSAGNV